MKDMDGFDQKDLDTKKYLEDGVPLVVVEDGDTFLSSRLEPPVIGGSIAASTL